MSATGPAEVACPTRIAARYRNGTVDATVVLDPVLPVYILHKNLALWRSCGMRPSEKVLFYKCIYDPQGAIDTHVVPHDAVAMTEDVTACASQNDIDAVRAAMSRVSKSSASQPPR